MMGPEVVQRPRSVRGGCQSRKRQSTPASPHLQSSAFQLPCSSTTPRRLGLVLVCRLVFANHVGDRKMSEEEEAERGSTRGGGRRDGGRGQRAPSWDLDERRHVNCRCYGYTCRKRRVHRFGHASGRNTKVLSSGGTASRSALRTGCGGRCGSPPLEMCHVNT